LTAGFPCLLESLGKFWGFLLENSRTRRVLENHFGLEKCWKLKIKVLESSGKIFLKITHVFVGLNENHFFVFTLLADYL